MTSKEIIILAAVALCAPVRPGIAAYDILDIALIVLYRVYKGRNKYGTYTGNRN